MTVKELREQVKLSGIKTVAIEFTEEPDVEVDLCPANLPGEYVLMNEIFEAQDKFLDEINDCEVVELDLRDGILFIKRSDDAIEKLKVAAEKFKCRGYKLIYVE